MKTMVMCFISHRFSDAVLLFKNDTLSKLCSSVSDQSRAGVSYKSMNSYMANCLAGLTLPTDTLTPTG